LAEVSLNLIRKLKMKKIAPVFLLVLALASCTTAPIKPEQKASLHNIAVVSLMGNELEFTKVGFTVFNNDKFTRETSDWKLDAEIERIATEELKKSSSEIKMVLVPFDRAELFKIYKPADSWGEYASIDRITPELKMKLAQTPVDAVLLVHKQRGEDPIAMTSVYLQGYGVYYRTLPLVDPLMKPYAMFTIVLLDGKTLKPITAKYVRGVSTAFGKTQLSWDEKIKNNLSDQLLSEFKSDINTVIESNLESGLKEMGL